ncbi:MAG: hypothetical protein DRJ07_08190 [Bacteroidetes bacterium]|nr:MAG: hypothetical protein DRJ07_08190 [Bacteroidota bacterium]
MENKNKTNQTSKKPQEEEVDLGNLFIVIGKGIKNIFNFIGNIFKGLFHYFILLLIFLKKHVLKLSLALLLGFIVGFIFHKLDARSYVSDMIIETNYGSGIQLYKQIDYLNDLVKKKDSVALSNVLNIDINEAVSINEIKVFAYQPDRNFYKAYDEYLQKTDTIYTRGFTFEDYKKRIAEYDLRFHMIEINSKSKTVFANLSPSLINLVENNYYKQLKDLKVNELHQKISVLNKNLQQIDTLRNTYKEVALKEAEKLSSSSTIEISKSEKEKDENDIKLFQTSNEILYSISETNKDLIRKNNVINIISDFDKVGVPDKNITHKKYFQFAVLFFGVMLGWILLRVLNRYLSSYQ